MLQGVISNWPRNYQEYILLLLNILFQPRETGTVERIQNYFSQLLFKYLLTSSEGDKRSQAAVRFGRGMDCKSKCTELQHWITKNMTNTTTELSDADILMLFD